MCPQASERWDILKICNYIIPRNNCVGKEAVLISGSITTDFMKSIRIFTSIQRSAVRR